MFFVEALCGGPSQEEGINSYSLRQSLRQLERKPSHTYNKQYFQYCHVINILIFLLTNEVSAKSYFLRS
mgnify:CR=1 FL=1